MATPLSWNLEWDLANKQWAASLNPVIASPTNNMQILPNVSLIVGDNIINHRLGRMMQGWFLTDLQGVLAQLPYRSAPFNSTTLTLNSSAVVVCSIGVF